MPWRKGQKWVAQVRQGRRRIQKVFPSKTEAWEWEAGQRQIPAEEWGTRTASSLGAIANDYLDYSKTRHSEKVYQEKRGVLRRLFAQVDSNLPVDRLSADTVRLFLQSQATQRSGHASNKDRKNLLALMAWIARFKGIINNCVSVCERFPEVRQPRYVPPEEDFWRIHDAADGQDKTMLLAYLHLAARRSELFRLVWDDVDFGAQTVRLRTRKRKDGSWEYDHLPMTKDLFDALLSHRLFSSAESVFPVRGGGAYKYRIHFMRRLCRKAGVRPFGFHAIRHLSATLLAQADVPMIQISQILRHKNLRTTERYLQRLGDLQLALEKAFKKPQKESG